MQRKKKYRVLVVDDDEMLRVLVVSLLEALSCETESAASAEEALALLQRKAFDVICTDLEMPGMDGLELIHRVRGSSRGTSIVLMTGRDDDERTRTAGADAFLHKPFSADELRRALGGVFQRAGAAGNAGEL
jgi:CheY-like chemotaxis protein